MRGWWEKGKARMSGEESALRGWKDAPPGFPRMSPDQGALEELEYGLAKYFQDADLPSPGLLPAWSYSKQRGSEKADADEEDWEEADD